jgi:hypothetical protein
MVRGAKATVAGIVAAVIAVAVGIPLAVAAVRDGGPRPATRSAPAPTTGRPAASPEASVVALTRRVPCPERAGPATGRSRTAPFHAVTAVSCDRADRIIRGARWEVEVRGVAVSGIPRLVRALRLPSERRSGTTTCTANIELAPSIALVDARGRYLVPRVPVDACDHPLQAVMLAFDAVGWREVSARPVRRQASRQAVAAGCDMKAKNLLDVYAGLGAQRSGSGPVAPSLRRPTHVCVFRVTRADREVGSFVRGFALRPDASRRLLGALTGPAPGGECPPVRVFAFVTIDGGPYVQVELGGCWRVERSYPREGVGTADPAVAAAVLGRG